MPGDAPGVSGRPIELVSAHAIGSLELAGVRLPAANVVGTLQAAISKINALPTPPAFVLHTGDLTQLSKDTEFDTLDQALKGLKISVSTPGSGTDAVLRFLLTKYGLNPDRDVQILTTGSVVNSQAAYAQGSVPKADAA